MDSFSCIKPDWWIRYMALEQGMITPFVENQVREGVISYGLSSFGYDLRVADEFLIFTTATGELTVIDPKVHDERSMAKFQGPVCIIPPNSFALARSVEYFRMPRNVLGLCLGKSTYARAGIITNFTPFEPCYSDDTEIMTNDGWKLIKDVKVGDMVLGMLDDGSHGMVPVEKKQEYSYTGNMLHFGGRQLDLFVTPDHKVFVQKRTNGYRKDKEFTKWSTEKASDVFGKYNYKMTRKVRWSGKDVTDQLQIGERLFDTNTFLKFLGAYLGDGYSHIQKGGHRIVLTGKKSRKRKYFKELCISRSSSESVRSNQDIILLQGPFRNRQ